MARIVNFVDGAESETTPTIGNIVASNLVQYANDAAYVAGEDGAPAVGNVYYNTTDNTIRYYNGAWSELIDEASIQAIDNKVIDANTNTITNIDNNEIKPLAGIEATKLADGSVTDTELQYINSVTSNVQDQIDGKQSLSEKGAANGYPSLDSGGKIPTSQLPPIALTDVSVVADTAARDALVVEEGDVAFVTADSLWYIYDGTTWLEISASGAVSSVNGQTGAVLLDLDDINDVTETTPVNGQVLTYSGGSWVNQDTSVPELSVTTVTANYSVVASDDVVVCDTTSGIFTVTLPDATTVESKPFTIKRTGTIVATGVTIATVSAQTIDLLSSYSLELDAESITVISDGSNWLIMNNTSEDRSFLLGVTGSGDFTAGQIRLTKSGKNVTMQVTVAITFASTTIASSAIALIPGGVRTNTTVYNCAYMDASGVIMITANSNGQLVFTSRNWAGGGFSRTSVPVGLCMSWSTDVA